LLLLNDNPLPSSVDIFIKPGHLDSTLILNLKKELMKLNAVSDVVYPHRLMREDFEAMAFLIRIKSVE